jgi:manganese oxidase
MARHTTCEETDVTEERTIGAIATAVVAVVALILAAGALIASAGGGSAGVPAVAAASDAPATVSVDLSEFAISPSSITIAAGGTLEVTNSGSADHDLAIEGTDIATPMLGAGESATLELGDLAPGTYATLCTVPGHDSAGMVGEIVVVDADGAAEGATEDSANDAHADHGAEPDWAALDQAMHDTILEFPAETEGQGNQVLEPEEILEDGTKVFRLIAERFDWERAPGDVVEAWGYNGQVPGPMIRTDVGDNVQVIVENHLPMGTDVHWHGLRVPNDQDGVAPVTQPLIEPGEEFVYEFTTTEPAIGMYHPHHHGQHKLPDGMFGAFIVGDTPIPHGQTVSGREIPEADDMNIAVEIPMILNDAGAIGMSLNGKSFPATEPIVVEQGDWVVLHYYNEGLQIHPMHLHQFPQLVFAKDGFPLDAPQWEDTVNVAPGERYSVLVQATDPGVWVLHCHILTHAERDTGMFGMVTAMIVE